MSFSKVASIPVANQFVTYRTGSQRLVSIPDFSGLSKSVQAAIYTRLEHEQSETAVDATALHARLDALRSPSPSSPSTAPTSPPDFAAETKHYDLLEEQAYHLLRRDGCPPCYPFDPLLSVQQPPTQCRGIISYWEANPSSEGGVLHAQRTDWHRFCDFQKANRRSDAQFAQYICERRRKRHFPRNVRLRFNSEEQSQLETWIEFQEYHLHTHEQLQKNVEEESRSLQMAQVSQLEEDSEEAKTRALCQEGYRYRRASAIQRMELHRNQLLPWIEQQRMRLLAAQPRPPCTRKRERSVLGPIRSAISKLTPRKRSLRSQQLLESVGLASASSVSPANTTRIRHHGNDEPQKTRGHGLLRPLHPQEVTKSTRRSCTSTHEATIDVSPPARKTWQWKCKPRKPSPIVTRSGRTSKRPVRPGFVPY